MRDYGKHWAPGWPSAKILLHVKHERRSRCREDRCSARCHQSSLLRSWRVGGLQVWVGGLIDELSGRRLENRWNNSVLFYVLGHDCPSAVWEEGSGGQHVELQRLCWAAERHRDSISIQGCRFRGSMSIHHRKDVTLPKGRQSLCITRIREGSSQTSLRPSHATGSGCHVTEIVPTRR